MPAALLRGDLAIDLDIATVPVFLPALVTLYAAYPALAPRFTAERQCAWVLTTVVSAIMTLSSLPFIVDYATRSGIAGVQMPADAAVASFSSQPSSLVPPPPPHPPLQCPHLPRYAHPLLVRFPAIHLGTKIPRSLTSPRLPPPRDVIQGVPRGVYPTLQGDGEAVVKTKEKHPLTPDFYPDLRSFGAPRAPSRLYSDTPRRTRGGWQARRAGARRGHGSPLQAPEIDSA
ncbi:hypothetical protein B0H19DRAFT_1371591 [Mycena capillaripes]|nr:hypothetical protein B0H19DRAFT_1371591 [Mycena capillaripes]